ncbi:hypothetical protein V2J09_005498, partial [Rumex salicifolius]
EPSVLGLESLSPALTSSIHFSTGRPLESLLTQSHRSPPSSFPADRSNSTSSQPLPPPLRPIPLRPIFLLAFPSPPLSLAHKPLHVRLAVTLPPLCSSTGQALSLHFSFAETYNYKSTSLHLNLANYTMKLNKMGNFKKYQILILSLIVVLPSLTPFLSSSIRLAHLYIVINILILTVGVESGLLSAFPNPPNEEKKSVAKIVEPKKRVDFATNLSTTNKIFTLLVKQSNMEKINTVAIMDTKKLIFHELILHLTQIAAIGLIQTAAIGKYSSIYDIIQPLL